MMNSVRNTRLARSPKITGAMSILSMILAVSVFLHVMVVFILTSRWLAANYRYHKHTHTHTHTHAHAHAHAH
jgi:hypothetical protein